ncbi:MAG: AMP-binding protein [Deltaproteobacteria bacterium]|nr:AMP-binding protein [Deltaproteobacteria bacterium]
MNLSRLVHADTLPKLLLRNRSKFGSSQAAAREKTMGIWQSYSWEDYYSIVKHLCLAFVSMGLEKGDRVSILGENKPHVYWFELAAQSARAVVVGVFADCTPPEVEYYLSHSGSRFVVCQDQEQVDKVLEIIEKIPQLEKIIYWDPKGLWSYTDPLLISMEEMIETGKAYAKELPDRFEEMVVSTEGNDLAVFLYSSGTTGKPKAAMVTHKALIGMAAAVNEVDRYQENEEYLSFLPIAWIAEQLFGVACSLYYCLRTNFPEEPETVQANIREVGPQVVFFGPRLWENLIRTIQLKIQDSGFFNRVCYNAALTIGRRRAAITMRGGCLGIWLAFWSFVAERLVFRSLRDNIGLLKTRVGYSAGAAISPDVISYFHAIGVNIKQLYGGSEVGVVTLHKDYDIKPESCGPPLPGVDIQISEEGEILVRTPNMFSGYYGEEEKTNKKLVDGWYRSEDFGHLDNDAHLIVMDRMEDLLEMADGKKFSPQFCEVRLRFSPYIKDVLVVARKGEVIVGALINIDLNNVGQWAESNHIAYTTFVDLSQKPDVIELVRKEVAKVNQILPDYSQIGKFINLHKEFDPDEAEMTRTRKLRRTFVESRFKPMIDAIFGDAEKVEVTSEITYRDGRTGLMKNEIMVVSV